ncbi:MAG: carboxylating nicotinate-nucleotide diphosphorylase [Proteobacteria bacterium]|nr:carboxylating nicotinate-nucleotide diphosphorylase [Pseudomonadota bacterium]MBU1688045.1 carboxylating nicotinate-nucleotide diphosphorylase [Pseudomonadota bacterium]
MDMLTLHDAIRRFLAEDIGPGDITSEPIFPPDQLGTAEFVAQESFITAGCTLIAPAVFQAMNPNISCSGVTDGTRVSKDEVLFTAQGPVIDLLKAERVALNLVQRCCGIATLTRRFVDLVADLPVRVVDTRKTVPGLRMLDKYAVKAGGGANHRMNLADGILIKDNHIASCGSITQAVNRVRNSIPHTLKIEVETDTLDQVVECLECGVEVIMLDNMTTDQMRQAVKMVAGRALLEASGGVTLSTIRSIAETGVDIISVGALTHSAPACDISMRLHR